MAQASKAKITRRKQFTLDAGVIHAVEALARATGGSVDTLTEDALRDLLKKHRRPISFKDALRDSVRAVPANDREPKQARAKAMANCRLSLRLVPYVVETDMKSGETT